MSVEIDRILDGMSEEFLRTGKLEIARWVRRYPEHREQILEYRLDLEWAPTAEEIEAEKGPWRDAGASQAALKGHFEALSFGEAWLQEGVEGQEGPEAEATSDDELARELSHIRSAGHHQEGRASRQFRKAVVLSWAVNQLTARKRRTTRFTMTKVCYLLEQAMNLGVFSDHRRRRWGPYDPESRYKDAEPIVTKNKYLGIRGTAFTPGPKIGDALKYAPRYLLDPSMAERLIERLSHLSDAELETWSTVHWAASDLVTERMVTDAEMIRTYLAKDPVWRPKLDQANFGIERMSAALNELRRLGLVVRA